MSINKLVKNVVNLASLSPIDRDIVKKFRIVLYSVFRSNPPRSRDDLDILSYRLLNVLKEETSWQIYKDTIRSWKLSKRQEEKALGVDSD